MENRINIAELLKDCPKGMELDCTMYNKVTLSGVYIKDTIFPITVLREDGTAISLTKYGQYADADYAKCVIFPKGKDTWEGFQIPFKDGDILSYQYEGFKNRTIYIYMYHNRMNTTYYVALSGDSDSEFMINYKEGHALDSYNDTARFATEEEKQKLFDAIKANGYKWNEKTKILELIEPKFKVGDRIRHKDSHIYCTLGEYSEGISAYRTSIGGLSLTYKDLEQWELFPDKFDITTLKPFDRVLVRTENFNPAWTIDFYDGYRPNIGGSFTPFAVTGGKYFQQCIPYEENKHLSGTTNDCSDFYKTWEK